MDPLSLIADFDRPDRPSAARGWARAIRLAAALAGLGTILSGLALPGFVPPGSVPPAPELGLACVLVLVACVPFACLVRQLAETEREVRRATERALKRAQLDPLTGLGNARRLETALDAEWRRCQRAGLKLALVRIDIDRLAEYNRRYGSHAGDRCLRLVAQQVEAAGFRPGDLATRTGAQSDPGGGGQGSGVGGSGVSGGGGVGGGGAGGGGGFALLLPDTDEAGAEAVAARIFAAVAGLHLPHPATPTRLMTVSLGVAATLPRLDRAPGDLMDAAQQALARAKHLGRDRIETAAPRRPQLRLVM